MKKPVRCLVCFWGVGGAGVRYSERVAGALSLAFGPENIALSLHEQNAFVERAGVVAGSVHQVTGVEGRKSVVRLATSLPGRLVHFGRQIVSQRTDVVVFPMNFAQALPAAATAAALGCRLVYVAHDASPHPGDYAPMAQIATQNVLLRLASRIVTVSHYVESAIQPIVGARRTSLITSVPLTAHCKPVAQKARTRRGPILRMLFLGRILNYKGLSVLRKALEMIRGRVDWSLTIAGYGTEADYVCELYADLPQVDLTYVRWLLEDDINALIDGHDAVICPYIEASQSGIISEAATLGLPAIVTPVGALPEQVGFGASGWIAASCGAADIASALVRAIEDRETYEARSAAALEMTRADQSAESWAAIARDALAARGH